MSSRVREKRRSFVARDMRLGANAVVLILDDGMLEFRKGLFRVFGGGGEHEADGMKKAHPGLGKLVAGGENHSLADVANQHVRAAHGGEIATVGLGDRLLHLAFL